MVTERTYHVKGTSWSLGEVSLVKVSSGQQEKFSYGRVMVTESYSVKG